MNSLVSVIIPTYNNATYIRVTIESVLAQTYLHYEILVVDDGSTDDTRHVLKPVMDRIQYIPKANAGPASARNLGIKKAKGEFIAFLDADDRWLPNKLHVQMEFMNLHRTIGLVYTSTEIIDQEGNRLPQFDKPTMAVETFMQLFEHNVIATSSVLVRKVCFDSLGLFDENKNVISVEDYDMWLRIAANFRLLHVNMPLLQYRRHAQGISRNFSRSYRAEANVIRKNVQLFASRYPELKGKLFKRLLKIYQEWMRDAFYIYSRKLKGS